MLIKNIFDGWLNRGCYISPGQYCYSIGLHNPLIVVPVQCYLMLVNRIHLMPLIFKQQLLPVSLFTIKQASLIIIKCKAFRNYTLFCIFAVVFLLFFVYPSLRIHLCLKAINSIVIFPPSSSFIRLITFLFIQMGSGLSSSFEYPLVSNLFFTSFVMSL